MDTPATMDNMYWDSMGNTVEKDSTVWEAVEADCALDERREYVPAPDPYPVDQTNPAESSDEWATYCRNVRL